jgi:predicted TIM-barrel fold metal-dependent hydrolase
MFDINAKIGHWPYRPVPSFEDMLASMDACGIEQAAVYSLNAVHYLNPHDGNEEVAKAIAPHRDRLVPFAVLRANFAGWQDDMEACLNNFGMLGFVLLPNYHHYALDDAALEPLMARAAEAGLPVCVQVGLEDPRRQYDREKVFEVPASEVGDFARAYPDVTVIALGLKFGQPQQAGDPLPDNFYFDTSNYECMGDLEAAVELFGAGRILFGTNFPLFNPLANVDKLRLAGIPEEGRNAIASANAHRILGIAD